MIGLETERLIFRQWETSDFEHISYFYADEENARFVGGTKTPEAAWRLMATYVGHYTLKGFSYLAIEEKSTTNFVGTVGLWDSAPWPEPELGYWLMPNAQRKGFGLEAGKAVLQYGLETVQLDSLVSYIDPTNEPSKKLALNLGAKPDGSLNLLDFGDHEVYRYR